MALDWEPSRPVEAAAGIAGVAAVVRVPTGHSRAASTVLNNSRDTDHDGGTTLRASGRRDESIQIPLGKEQWCKQGQTDAYSLSVT
ncbi:hypothetical protein PTI98_013467 [Pleurotus ostreatus]|nr:hypothetical protein PTI98_013467 [Pleurotus ostreatus]